MTSTLGTHVIAVCEQCTNNDVMNAVAMERLLVEIATKNKFTVVKTASHQFKNPDAATVLAILTQSHIIIHTWPEHNKATIDIFSCGPHQHIDEFITEFSQTLGGTHTVLQTHAY